MEEWQCGRQRACMIKQTVLSCLLIHFNEWEIIQLNQICAKKLKQNFIKNQKMWEEEQLGPANKKPF